MTGPLVVSLEDIVGSPVSPLRELMIFPPNFLPRYHLALATTTSWRSFWKAWLAAEDLNEVRCTMSGL